MALTGTFKFNTAVLLSLSVQLLGHIMAASKHVSQPERRSGIIKFQYNISAFLSYICLVLPLYSYFVMKVAVQ